MRATLPSSGDPERDALLAEILALHDRMRDRAIELVGPLELPADITMQQLRVLGLVAQTPGMTGHELGAQLGVSAPTASGLIDRLAEKGLVERADDASDRRVRRLHPTAEGIRTLGGVDTVFGKLMETVMPPIPTADLEAIRAGSAAMLRAVHRALEGREAGSDVS
ncbi:MAG: MarR family transcriptional regulator [Propionicimonas sp.]|nr:MarR family transcriptional regulator [Propionicimonas sp.]